MRGALVGSLALIVLYVALQPGSADKLGQGSNVFAQGLRRMLAPDVAGVPQRATAAAGGSGSGSVGGGIGGIIGRTIPQIPGIGNQE